MDSAPLLPAAQLERDRRAESYPAKIHAAQRDGVGPDGSASKDFAEALTIDYQCWVAIAEWVETDRFFFFHGGAEPARDDAPFIRWPELEAAAARALTSINGKIDALDAAPKATPESLGALRHRRSCLFAIHHKLQRTRETVDVLNAELRKPRQLKAAA